METLDMIVKVLWIAILSGIAVISVCSACMLVRIIFFVNNETKDGSDRESKNKK